MEGLDFYCFVEPTTEEYREVVELIRTSRFDHPKLDVSQGFSAELLFASINVYYFQFFCNKQNNLLIKPAPNPLLELINNYSRSFKTCKALERLANNFDRRSGSLSLSSSLKSNKNPALLKLNIFALTYLNRRSDSKYIRLFYSPEGFLHDFLESSFNSSSVVCGLPSSRLTRLMFLLENYEELETTRVFKCSADCDFIYYISDCGLTEEESICPYCKKNIGGLNSKTHRVDEQIVLTREKAHLVISKLIQKYLQKEMTGIHVLKVDQVSSELLKVEEIDFHLISVFIKANLVVLIELKLYDPKLNSSFFVFDEDEFSQEEISGIKRDHYKRFLHGSIDKHLAKIKEFLNKLEISSVFACLDYFFFNFLRFLQENSELTNCEINEEGKTLEFRIKLSEFVMKTIETWKEFESNHCYDFVVLGPELLLKKYLSSDF